MRVLNTLKRVKTTASDAPVHVKGWIRSCRVQKRIAFVHLTDGSDASGLQLVLQDPDLIERCKAGLKTGASLSATGKLIPPQEGRSLELDVSHADIIGACAADYPISKKFHGVEFLRTLPHLRPRTQLFAAIARLRNSASMGVHHYFQNLGLLHLHAPIITSADCEGAGEQFSVTSSKEKQFFGVESFLTVSAQLHAEIFAAGLPGVYTFGPTFRAEKSNASKHLAEFWMIEPEIAFTNLSDIMEVSGELVKYTAKYVLNTCEEDLALLDSIRPLETGSRVSRLEKLVNDEFIQLPYTEAITALQKSGKVFEYPVVWGMDLQTEHERYLCEVHTDSPVFITHYPSGIKPFYMKPSGDDKTVLAMDMLIGGIGELVGGSERISCPDELESSIAAHGLDPKAYSWYMDLRRYGGVPHSGFGLGFDRLLMYITGMANVRDVSPIPRAYKECEL